MYKDYRYWNAGENAIHRWGHKAVDKVLSHLEVNDRGYVSFPVDGGKYWTIGTSNGKYGEFARLGETCFSVNKGGFVYAKEGTEKFEILTAQIKRLADQMRKMNGIGIEEEEE